MFDDVSPDSRLAQEEIFGPVLSILTFTDLDAAMRFSREVRPGVVWVNS